MSYKTEKEPNGKEVLIIGGFDTMAPDPYSGTNKLFDVNTSTPGEVSVGYPITSSTVTGGPIGIPVWDSTRYFPTYATPSALPQGYQYSYAIYDQAGKVWESTTYNGTWARLSSGDSPVADTNEFGSIAYYLGYLFRFRSSAIDYWNGTTWSMNWKSANYEGGTLHPSFVATDNGLYFGNGNYLGLITAADPAAPEAFDPTTALYTPHKLRLPVTDIVVSLAEIGLATPTGASTLLIGGAQNAIYPWDKTSSSFGLPIYVADSYIKKMVSVNQNAFIFPGRSLLGNDMSRGRIFITNGSQADLFFKIPDYVFAEQDPYYQWGDVIFHRNSILWGMFVAKNNQSSILLFSEVYRLDLETKAFTTVSSIPANATAQGNAKCLISISNPNSASPGGFAYLLAWDDNGSAAGIGYSNTQAGIGTFNVVTDLMPVGTLFQKMTPSQVEYKLRSPLQSGESIQIFPIVDGVSSSALSFQPTPTTGVLSGVAPANFQNAQWLQFQVLATGNSASSGVRLNEIRIR